MDWPVTSTKRYSINLIGVNGLSSTGGSDSGTTISQAITSGLPSPSPSPSMDLTELTIPLSTPDQTDTAPPPLDPVVGEENEEDNENNEDDYNSAASDEDNEGDGREDDEDSVSFGRMIQEMTKTKRTETATMVLMVTMATTRVPVNFGPNGPVD